MLAWLAAPDPVYAEEKPTVILLSLDGVRPDYLERSELPGFGRVMREGAAARRLVPVFPTTTFPNHTSLATGASPDRHGIVGNTFLDSSRGVYRHYRGGEWLLAEPIWTAAERQGVRAAVFYWIGSETAWRGIGATYRKAPFDSKVPESEKVDQILDWLDLPAERRPQLILSWWHGADSVGHREGPDDAYIGEALRRQDRQIRRLLAGLDDRQVWATTTLLIVSDHGMARVDRVIDLESELARRGLFVKVCRGGGMAHVYVDDATPVERVRRALERIEGVRAVPGRTLPRRLRAFHPGRTGDLVALTDPPRTFQAPRALVPQPLLEGDTFGSHGYDPERPDMAGILLAMGRGTTPGTELGAPYVVDVAPTVAALLGIAPPRQAEGRTIPGVGPPNPDVAAGAR